MYVKLPNFHQLMQCTLYLQYTGFSIPIFKIRNNKTLAINQVSIWLELAILHTITIVLIYYTIIMQNKEEGINVFLILSHIVTFTSILFTVIGGWEVKTKARLMKSIFEKIKALEETIKFENNQMHYLTVQFTIWSFATTTMAVVTILSYVFLHFSLEWTAFLLISALRLYVAPAVHLLQFFTLITLVRYYLESIDQQLSKIRQSELNGKEECKTYVSFRAHFRDGEDCKTANQIENIRKIYGKVHDLKRDINEAYNMRIWMDTTATALKILYFVYFNVITITWTKEKFFDTYYITQYYFEFWIVFLMLKFMENIRICGKVAACGKNLGIKVHEIFSSSYCESVRNELTTFSLELLHRDPRIKANNVFVIDYPLTASFLRGIIMQLIALLQINLPNIQSDYSQKFFGSQPTNVTTQMQNNSAWEAATLAISSEQAPSQSARVGSVALNRNRLVGQGNLVAKIDANARSKDVYEDRMSQDHDNFFSILQKALAVQYFVLSLPPLSIQNNGKTKIFKKAALLDFSLTLISATLEVGALIFLYKYTTYISIYNVLFITKTCSSIILGLVTTSEMLTKLGQMKITLNDIKELDTVIHLERKSLTMLKVKLVIWASVLMSMVILNTTTFIIYDYKIHVAAIIIFNSFRLYLQPFADQIQFLLLLNLVQIYFESVHNRLCETAIKTDGCKSHKSRYFYPGRIECEIADEIERIRKLYGRINDFKNSVNEIFSLRLSLAIIDGLLQYLTILYFLIVHLRHSDRNVDLAERLDFYSLIYQALVLTLAICQTVKLSEQITENGKLFRLNLQQSFSRFHCKRVSQELKIFSLELFHRDPNVTAFNIFIINNKLTIEIISEVIMILIAIMQFEEIGTTGENTAMVDYVTDT